MSNSTTDAQMGYLYLSESQQGPYTDSQIMEMLRTKQVYPSTQFWTEGMEAWTALSSIPKFQHGVMAFLGHLSDADTKILKQINGIGIYWIVFPIIGAALSLLGVLGGNSHTTDGQVAAAAFLILAVCMVFWASTIWAGISIRNRQKWAWWYLVIYSCLFFWLGPFNLLACPFTLYWLIKGRHLFR